jgi:predicted PurR-regulated permease PerM
MWKTLIHFTTKSVVKFWFLWLVFCFIWYLFFQSLNVVYMILTALIISVSMEWIIIAFENKVKQRWVAIAITYFLLVLFLLSW